MNVLRSFVELGDDLFGADTNISDGLVPFYNPPGGADGAPQDRLLP